MKKQSMIIMGIAFISLALSIVALWGVYDTRHKDTYSQNKSSASSTPPNPLAEGTINPVMPQRESQLSYPCQPPTTGNFIPPPCLATSTQLHQIILPAGVTPVSPPWSIAPSPFSATTSQFIGRGGVSDTTKLTPSDVLIAYSGDVLIYHNTTMGFEFGLPSIGKELRLNDTGSYSRKPDALVWLWFTKNYDIASANFFVTPSVASSLDALSFDYNFTGYPKFTGKLSSTMITVDNQPALEETISYESSSPNYPNTWKFVHILHDNNLYTFGVQVAPSQAVNVAEAEQMLQVFSNTFHFFQ